MSSPELRESSARMLKVTGGCWPRNVPIPRAASGDVFTSRMVRKWRVFPYGRNIAAVVSAVMDKDRQGAAQKPGQRGSGGLRRLRPPAEAGRGRRRSRASLQLARRRRQRRRRCRRPVEWRRSRRRRERCRCRVNVSPTSPLILVWRTILVVSRWLYLFIIYFIFYLFFFNLFVGTSQGRARAKLLWLRLPRRPRRLPQCQRRRAGLLALGARCQPSRLSWMRRALRPAG